MRRFCRSWRGTCCEEGTAARRSRRLDLIAVTIGQVLFTGIRAGLALAHGIGLAFGVPVIGVTVGEAIAEAFPHLGDRDLWVVTDSRRGHIFLERDGEILSLAVEAALPVPRGKVAIAGGGGAACRRPFGRGRRQRHADRRAVCFTPAHRSGRGAPSRGRIAGA